MHQFKTEQFLPIDLEKAWAFFSSPKNLSLITPPELDFKILTPLADENIYEGMEIDYTVKPFPGITVRWLTEICNVQKQKYFTDRQKKGPYKIWEHTHTFKEQKGGLLIQDLVIYKLPFSFIGNMVNSILVKKKIKNIFNYRKKVLETLFN
jgi:ligand-binding SRPBCC domain-containing protein